MYEVSLSGWFAAAHRLRLPDGRCEPWHGHNWHVTVTYAGDTLDEMGVLVDFTMLRRRLNKILASLHDRPLNDVPAFATVNPSAENVAGYIAGELGGGLASTSGATSRGAALRCVAVEEEPGCIARYYPPGGGSAPSPCG
jgi:6-pyruvoyltetrahydropterin/6-carboxytetrahydropterin synthase